MNRNSSGAQTVMHPLKARLVRVKSVQKLSRSMTRIVFSGPDLEGFTSLSPDDHLKLMLPQAGQEKPLLPEFGPSGPSFPIPSLAPTMRDYTPRNFDPRELTLTIDFFLHSGGVASQWASKAREGQYVAIGGPRGSRLLPREIHSWLLIGDEAALPSFGRMLDEFPATDTITILGLVDDAADEIPLPDHPGARIHWFHRSHGGVEDLMKKAGEISLPSQSFALVSAETSMVRSLREIVRKLVPLELIREHAYWTRSRKSRD